MATPNISFERPFQYVFKDPGWTKKILMGALYSLTVFILIGIVVLAGYTRKLFLILIKDENALIPEIEFGTDLSAGWGVVGVSLCYSLALMVLAIPLARIPCLGQLVVFVLGLSMVVVMPIALMRYMVTGRFGAAFDFAEIFAFIKANLTNVLLMVAIIIVARIIGQLGVLACIVGALFTGFWALIASTVAMADVWRMAEQASQSAPPPPPPTNPAP